MSRIEANLPVVNDDIISVDIKGYSLFKIIKTLKTFDFKNKIMLLIDFGSHDLYIKKYKQFFMVELRQMYAYAYRSLYVVNYLQLLSMLHHKRIGMGYNEKRYHLPNGDSTGEEYKEIRKEAVESAKNYIYMRTIYGKSTVLSKGEVIHNSKPIKERFFLKDDYFISFVYSKIVCLDTGLSAYIGGIQGFVNYGKDAQIQAGSYATMLSDKDKEIFHSIKELKMHYFEKLKTQLHYGPSYHMEQYKSDMRKTNKPLYDSIVESAEKHLNITPQLVLF